MPMGCSLCPYTTLFRSTNGTVKVDGAGSRWINGGNIYVGGNENGAGGVGLLRIENCGTVRANATTVWNLGVLEIGLNPDRKSTRLNSSHLVISYAVCCL